MTHEEKEARVAVLEGMETLTPEQQEELKQLKEELAAEEKTEGEAGGEESGGGTLNIGG